MEQNETILHIHVVSYILANSAVLKLIIVCWYDI